MEAFLGTYGYWFLNIDSLLKYTLQYLKYVLGSKNLYTLMQASLCDTLCDINESKAIYAQIYLIGWQGCRSGWFLAGKLKILILSYTFLPETPILT